MSTKISVFLGGCGVAALVVAGALALGVLPTKSKNIAVLDLDRVQAESAAYVKVKTETEKHVSALKARFAEEEKALRTKAVELQKKITESGKVNAYEKEIQNINKKLAEFERKVRFQSVLIARARQTALSQVNPVAQATLKELSQKEGIEIVLPRPYVTHFAPSADMTDSFIKLLDSKDIQVNYPDPEQFTVPVAAEQGSVQGEAQQSNASGK